MYLEHVSRKTRFIYCTAFVFHGLYGTHTYLLLKLYYSTIVYRRLFLVGFFSFPLRPRPVCGRLSGSAYGFRKKLIHEYEKTKNQQQQQEYLCGFYADPKAGPVC